MIIYWQEQEQQYDKLHYKNVTIHTALYWNSTQSTNKHRILASRDQTTDRIVYSAILD